MKFVINLLGLAAIGFLGYVAEPFLRGSLVGMAGKPQNASQETPKASEAGPAASINLATLAPNQLPERVMLYADARVTDASSGVTMKIEAGNRVKLIRIEGENAVISPGEGPFQGSVPVNGTDLLEQLAANPPAAPVAPATSPTPAPAPVTPPAEVAAAEPVMPEPAPTPEPTVAEATPPPAETTPAAPTPPAAAADVVGAMQASIRAEQIKEFKFDQVQEWTQEPDEAIDGETYQIGIASYKAETMFGVRVIQAKALVKNGQVQRWVYRKSGMDMK